MSNPIRIKSASDGVKELTRLVQRLGSSPITDKQLLFTDFEFKTAKLTHGFVESLTATLQANAHLKDLYATFALRNNDKELNILFTASKQLNDEVRDMLAKEGVAEPAPAAKK